MHNEEDNNRDVIRPYVVDGIQEYDNPMPPWWVWMFILTCAFGFAYLIYVHGFGWSSLEGELAQDRTAHAEYLKAHGGSGSNAGDLEAKGKDPAVLAEGKIVFAANCAPCHGQSGEGIVGPNLTDKFWIHGGSAADVVKVIEKGVTEKGMLAWGPILGVQKVESVASYVLSIQGTHPANAKEAQGEEYKP